MKRLFFIVLFPLSAFSWIGHTEKGPIPSYDSRLEDADRQRYLDIVELLIIKGARVDAIESCHFRGETPLLCAVKANNLDIAKLLIEKGVDTHLVNYYGDTLLLLAAQAGNTAMVALLCGQAAHVEE